MPKPIVLRFTSPYSRYNAGERAGFTPEKASAILRLRPTVAVREGAEAPSSVPVHGDPIPFHRDPPPPGNPDPPTPPPATGDTPLPDDFPARDVLAAAGIATVEDLRTSMALGPLTEVDGIGETRAAKIREALEALGTEPVEE